MCTEDSDQHSKAQNTLHPVQSANSVFKKIIRRNSKTYRKNQHVVKPLLYHFVQIRRGVALLPDEDEDEDDHGAEAEAEEAQYSSKQKLK